MSNRQVDPWYSLELVLFLNTDPEFNWPYDKIAKVLETGKPFVAQVAKKTRSLTVEHYEKLEREIKQPLPVLLLKAKMASKLKDKSIAHDALKKEYEKLEKVLIQYYY